MNQQLQHTVSSVAHCGAQQMISTLTELCLTSPTNPSVDYFQYNVNCSPYTCYGYMVVNIFLSNLCVTRLRPCSLVLPVSPTLLYAHAHANAHICALIPCDDNDHCNSRMKDNCTKDSCTKDSCIKDSCTKDSCIKRQCFQGASTDLLDKASHLIAFCT